jgi:aryl-alcohol dehydrogenase-like predicted oxidoreductase
MRYKLFGKSGLRVSELCLGALTFGETVRFGAPREECLKIFNTYVEAGGNFIDTGDIYNGGVSEKWVGEFIASDRDHFVLCTKYTGSTRQGDPNFCGNHRKHMLQALDASLKRLNTDYIDVYWLHSWDYLTPLEEVLRTFDDVVRSGKVLYAGLSNTPAWIVSRADAISELRGWNPFIGVQIKYSLADRTVERDFLPMARELDLGVACWQPLGASLLTGDKEEIKLRTGTPSLSQPSEKEMGIAGKVAEIAREIGCSPAQVALNWIRQKESNVIPVVGARKLEHIKDNLGCLDFTLTGEQMAELNEVSETPLGFPHEALSKITNSVYGGLIDKIDNHRRR